MFESRNPTTGDRLATYPEHTAAEVETRVARVWSGWQSWSRTPLAERTAFLIRLADLLESRVDDYARLITLEMGKPLAEAQGEVKKAASGARHYAEAGPGYLADQSIPGTQSKVIYQSLGPVLGIMPWNLPFWQVLRFFIPAALVGNTVLVKHAETVLGCATALETLVRDAGGPDGLYVNLMVQRDVIPGIIADDRIRAVTVTGSVAAGTLGRVPRRPVRKEGGARTRRFRSVRRARRCRSRQGGPARRHLALFQQRPELHRREAFLHRQAAFRGIHGTFRRDGEDDRRRRPARRDDPARASGARRYPRQRAPAGGGCGGGRAAACWSAASRAPAPAISTNRPS